MRRFKARKWAITPGEVYVAAVGREIDNLGHVDLSVLGYLEFPEDEFIEYTLRDRPPGLSDKRDFVIYPHFFTLDPMRPGVLLRLPKEIAIPFYEKYKDKAEFLIVSWYYHPKFIPQEGLEDLYKDFLKQRIQWLKEHIY